MDKYVRLCNGNIVKVSEASAKAIVDSGNGTYTDYQEYYKKQRD